MPSLSNKALSAKQFCFLSDVRCVICTLTTHSNSLARATETVNKQNNQHKQQSPDVARHTDIDYEGTQRLSELEEALYGTVFAR